MESTAPPHWEWTAPLGPRQLLVLAVCDEPDCLLLQGVNLREEGWGVATAADGEEAVAVARRMQPDVITLDVMMPVMDGWVALELLKQFPETAHIPVVMCTAKVQEDDIARGYALGCHDYITKPYSPLDHGRRLRAVLDAHPPLRPAPDRTDAVETLRWLRAQPELLDGSLRQALLTMEFEEAAGSELVGDGRVHLRDGCARVRNVALLGDARPAPVEPQTVELVVALSGDVRTEVCDDCLDMQLRFVRGHELRPFGLAAGTLLQIGEDLRHLRAAVERFDDGCPPAFAEVPWSALSIPIDGERHGALREAVLEARRELVMRIHDHAPEWLLVRYAVQGDSQLAHALRVGMDPRPVLSCHPDAAVGFRGEQVTLEQLLERAAEDHRRPERAALVVLAPDPPGSRQRALHPAPPVLEGDGWFVLAAPQDRSERGRGRPREAAISLPAGWQLDRRLLARLTEAASSWASPRDRPTTFTEIWRGLGGTLFDATTW